MIWMGYYFITSRKVRKSTFTKLLKFSKRKVTSQNHIEPKNSKAIRQ
jgi:hypothetical protein